jgi:hypothetical protein
VNVIEACVMSRLCINKRKRALIRTDAGIHRTFSYVHVRHCCTWGQNVLHLGPECLEENAMKINWNSSFNSFLTSSPPPPPPIFIHLPLMKSSVLFSLKINLQRYLVELGYLRQSRLRAAWPKEQSSVPGRAKDFPLLLAVQTSSGSNG